MTHKISLTAMRSFGFLDVAAAVAHQAEQMKQWRERKKIVDALELLPPRPEWSDFHASTDPANDYGLAMAKWNELVRERPTLFPAPISHPDIMAAINEHGDPDFELIDDTPKAPTPDEVLAAKKNMLFRAVSDAENAALNKVTPPAKRRLFQLQLADVQAADAARMQPIAKRQQETMTQYYAAFAQLQQTPQDATVAATVKELEAELASLSAKLADPELVHAGARPIADQKVLDESAARQKTSDAIARKAAQAHSDIEDLTLANVDAFEIPSFEKEARHLDVGA
jgi:hypothetical protein